MHQIEDRDKEGDEGEEEYAEWVNTQPWIYPNFFTFYFIFTHLFRRDLTYYLKIKTFHGNRVWHTTDLNTFIFFFLHNDSKGAKITKYQVDPRWVAPQKLDFRFVD